MRKIAKNRYGYDFTQETVPWVNTLEARAEDGRAIALLFEHAAHPVVTTGCGEISADFPAYAIKRINRELGNEIMPIFAQGCCGNINAQPPGIHSITSGWHEKAEEAGEKLGEATLVAMRKSKKLKAEKFTMCSKTIMLPYRLPSMEEWKEKAARLKKEDPDNEDENKSWQLVKGILERGEQPTLRFQVDSVALGSEWILVTMPAEMFSEYELWVNACAPFDHNMVLGYTNGRHHYMPTDKALALSIKNPRRAGIRGSGRDPAVSGCSAALSAMRPSTHDVRLPLAVGIERMIKEGIASLWTD